MKKKIAIWSIVILMLVVYYGTISFVKYRQDNIDLEKEYIISSYVTDDMRENSNRMLNYLCLEDELTPEKIGNDADCIILAKVISLDDVENEGYLFGMTFGKMLVNTVISGNLKQGQVINYAKPGGIMSYSEWEETQPEEANSKRKYLREQSGIEIDLNSTYIDLLAEGDIEIEAGKTYLVYLKYMKSTQSYEIIGLGNGLREVDMPRQSKTVKVENLDVNSLSIKNNKTGENESLKKYMDEHID